MKRRNSRILLPCLVLLAALAVCEGAAQAGPPLTSPLTHSVPHDLIPEIPDPDRFVSVEVGDYFSCDIPPDWSRIDNHGSGFGLSNEEKKTYGFYLNAPSPGELPVTIAIFYYAEGNLMYRSVEHYLRVFAQPALGVPLEGSSYGEIAPTKVAGGDGMVFERVKKEYVPRESGTGGPVKPGVYIRPGLNATWIPIRERFVVLPAKSGFYALRYTAPEGKFQEFLPVFEKVTKRFYPGGRYSNESRDTERGTSHGYGNEVY